MKRPRMTFGISYAMASSRGGSQPGVTVDDYARHVLARWLHFGEGIVAGAVAHLCRVGQAPTKPARMPHWQWDDIGRSGVGE